MTRDGIRYEAMPDEVDAMMVRSVATPFRAGVSKLNLTNELIELVHQQAQANGASEVWLGKLSFETLNGADGTLAYTYVVFCRDSEAMAEAA